MFTVNINGLRELQTKMTQLPAQLKSEVNGHIQRGAEVFVRNAQRDAPKDVGFLTGGITFRPNPVSALSVEVVSNAEYSPYQEFGTITFAKLGVQMATAASQQPTLPAYAMKFKGKGLRKRGGIYPHPFFFKQLPLAKATIEKGLANLLKSVKL